MIFKTLTLLITLLTTRVFAESSERGMLPLGVEYRECKVGMVIECKTEECDSICAANLAQEKEQEENQKEATLEEIIDKGSEEDRENKNPALFQVEQ